MARSSIIMCPHCRARVRRGDRHCPHCEARVRYGPDWIREVFVTVSIVCAARALVWYFAWDSELDAALWAGWRTVRDLGIPAEGAIARFVIAHKWPALGVILLAVGVLRNARSVRFHRTYR